MEEIKVWAIGNNGNADASQLVLTDQTKSEKLLEDILVKNPIMLENGLQLIGRQTPAAGGNLDLLGVDSNGRLVVFELKRGTLTREAVAQVIDYASDLDEMDLRGKLYEHIAGRSGIGGIQQIDDFEEWYNNNFGPTLDSLTPPRMVLVGLGADDTTERMVKYLANSGANISLLTFYGFTHKEETLFARYTEATASDTPSRRQRSVGAEEKRKQFEERAAELGVLELYNAARNMFQDHFDYKFHYASQYRMNFNRDSRAYLFIELDEDNRGIKPGFHPRAIDLAFGEFKEVNVDDFFVEKDSARNASHTERVDYEIKFPLYSLDEWHSRMTMITRLTKSVYAAYRTTQSD